MTVAVYSRKKRCFFAFFFVSALALLLFASFSSKARQTSLHGTFGLQENAPEVQIKTLSFTRTEGGKTAWTVEALQAELSKTGGEARLKEVQVSVPYGDGHRLHLEGDEGRVHVGSQDFSIWKKSGLMTVDLDHGYTLETSALAWDAQKRVIVSRGRAHLLGEGLELEGARIEISSDHQEVTLLGDVKALVY